MPRSVGEEYTALKVTGPSGSVELERILVDTGAMHSMIARSLADRLGIEPEGSAVVDLIGGDVELPMATAVLEIEGRSLRVPVILGDQNLVGLTTLETLLFAVDPTTERLIRRRGVLFAVPPALAAA